MEIERASHKEIYFERMTHGIILENWDLDFKKAIEF